MVGMDLRVAPVWHVEAFRRWRLQMRPFFPLEDVSWQRARGAMDPPPGDLAAPVRGARARLVERREDFAVPPALAHVRHLILDAPLVFGSTHARRIDEEIARLHVVGEG